MRCALCAVLVWCELDGSRVNGLSDDDVDDLERDWWRRGASGDDWVVGWVDL